MVKSYDVGMFGKIEALYYGGSDFYNFGYWTANTANQREASENLVEKLLDWLPRGEGKILDVACGLGATTRQVCKHYAPKEVVAINLSRAQLSRASQNAPGCAFGMADATNLPFADNSFDAVLCVEAAFHFKTRQRFLEEAFRVLKPGGRLAHSDILLRRMPRFVSNHFFFPPENYVVGPTRLKRLLDEVGFSDSEVINATPECWHGFKRSLQRWPGQERRAGRSDGWLYGQESITANLVWLFFACVLQNYVMLTARKPLSGAGASRKQSG